MSCLGKSTDQFLPETAGAILVEWGSILRVHESLLLLIKFIRACSFNGKSTVKRRLVADAGSRGTERPLGEVE